MKALKLYLLSSQHLQALLLLHLSFCLFACLNCMTRFFSADVTPLTLAFYRTLFGLVFALSMLSKIPDKAVQLKKFNKINIIKSFVDSANLPLGILAIVHLPLASNALINFLVPIISVAIAGWYLKDKMPATKWVSCCLALVGAIVALNPQFQEMNIYVLIAFAACICTALANVLTQDLLGKQNVTVVMFYTNFLRGVILLPFFLVNCGPPSLYDICSSVILAGIAFTATSTLLLAYQKATISKLTKYEYTRLIITGIFAFICFGEIPAREMYIGSLIIIASIYLFQIPNAIQFFQKIKNIIICFISRKHDTSSL